MFFFAVYQSFFFVCSFCFCLVFDFNEVEFYSYVNQIVKNNDNNNLICRCIHYKNLFFVSAAFRQWKVAEFRFFAQQSTCQWKIQRTQNEMLKSIKRMTFRFSFNEKKSNKRKEMRNFAVWLMAPVVCFYCGMVAHDLLCHVINTKQQQPTHQTER